MSLNEQNRRTIRTIFQTVIAFAAALPLLVEASGVSESWPGVALGLAVAGAITRIMALPVVDKLLPSWLRAKNPADEEDTAKAVREE